MYRCGERLRSHSNIAVGSLTTIELLQLNLADACAVRRASAAAASTSPTLERKFLGFQQTVSNTAAATSTDDAKRAAATTTATRFSHEDNSV